MTPYLVENFRKKLYNLINSSNLTFGEAYYVLKDVFTNVQNQYLEQSNIPPEENETNEEDEIIKKNDIIEEKENIEKNN